MTDTTPDVTAAPATVAELPSYVVLYDGVCGLCHRGVRALMDLDRDHLLHFAPLQGDTAKLLGVRWDDDGPASGDTFVFVDNTGDVPVHHERMDGVRAELLAIGRFKPVATILGIIPKPVADFAYKLIAASRYRLFGRFDECKLPSRSQRERFLA